MPHRTRHRPSMRWAWSLILLGVAGLIAVVPFAVWTRLGQRADERSRWSAAIPDDLRFVYLEALNRVSIPVIVVGMLVAVALALLRRRPELGIAAVLVIGGANVTTQLGKAFLPRRDFGIGAENTLPSGHMTVITSLVLALVIVLPRLLRVPAVVVGTFVATTGGAAIVILRWHRPSDVVAAVGVLAVWTGMAALVARAWSNRRARGRAGALPPTGVPLARYAGQRGPLSAEHPTAPHAGEPPTRPTRQPAPQWEDRPTASHVGEPGAKPAEQPCVPPTDHLGVQGAGQLDAHDAGWAPERGTGQAGTHRGESPTLTPADTPQRDLAGVYLALSLLGSVVAGVVLVNGGLVALEQRSNVLVAGFTLTAVAVAVAVLVALTAAAYDAVERAPHS